MALTLLEASKLVSGEVKRSAVIEMFAVNSDIMRILPWEDIPGDAISYNVEGKLPGVAFRGFNEGFDESTGVINPETERLRIAGGDLDVDRAIVQTRGPGVRARHEAMKVKALSLYITDKIINGDSQVNPREFDGLRVRVGGSQLFTGTGSASNGALSLEQLDSAIDAVDNPTHLIMSKAMKRKLSAAAKAGVGGDIETTKDDFGYQVTFYNGLPILIADYNDVGQRIIDFNEAGPAGGAVSTSIYVVSIGDGYISGIQNGTMEVRDLGEIDSKPVYRTRIDWLVGLTVQHGRALARVWGITNVAVTA